MSDTTIDTLVLDIQAPATSAAAELEKLAASLQKLRDAGKLTTVSNNLKKLSDGLNSIKMSSGATQKLAELTTSLAQLKEATKSNKLGSILNNLKRLPEITKQLKPEVIKTFSSRIKELSSALEPLSTQINSISTGFGRLPARLTNCVSAINKMEKSSKSLKQRLGGVGDVLQGFFGITLTGFAFGGYLSSSISEVNSFVENINYSNQVMGDYAQEAQNYAYQVQDVLGIDAGAFIEAQSTFMSLAQGFGLAGDKAYSLSKGMTELAYDISSFKDEQPEEVFVKLQSAIAGEIEPVRRWGVALDQASMKQWMLKNGIDANINSLTQADKALIRYNMTVETMAKNGAIYDLARTLSSPANAIRVLQQQFTQLSRAVGSVFIPILVAVIPYVQAFVKVLTNLITALAKLVGFKMPDWSNSDWGASSVSDTSDVLDDATDKAKEFKKQLMGFDELNIISSPSDSSSKNKNNSTSALDGLDVASVWEDGMLDSFQSKVDELVPKMKTLLIVAGAIGAGFAAWKIAKNLPTVLSTISTTLSSMKKIGVIPTLSFFTDEKGTALLTRLQAMPGLFKALPAPIKVAVGVTALLVAAFVDLWKNSKTFRTTVKKTLNDIGKAFKRAKKTIWTYGIQPLLNGFGITAGSVGELYTDHIRPALEKIGSFFVSTFGKVIVGALDLFSANFQFVTGVIKGLVRGDWSQAVDGIKKMFNLLPDSVKTAFSNLTSGAKEQLTIAKSTLHTAAVKVRDAVQGRFSEAKSNSIAYIGGISSGAKEKLAIAKTTLATAAGNVKTAVQTKFSEMKTNSVKRFEELKNSANSKLATAKTTLSSASGNIKSSVQDKFRSMKNNVVDYFAIIRDDGKYYINSLKEKIKSPINGIIGGVEKMANGIIRAINGMVKAFNKLSWKIPSWVPGNLAGKTFGFNLQTVSEIYIPRLEKGGFLEDGLFTMNRGEIAGKFNNGQSVVANNMHIIKGIRGGVMEGIKSAISGDLHTIAKTLSDANRINYRVVGTNAVAQTSSDSSQFSEAVYNAISENNGRGGTYTFVVNMDGDIVAKKVFKVHNDKVIQTGKSPLLV